MEKINLAIADLKKRIELIKSYEDENATKQEKKISAAYLSGFESALEAIELIAAQ